MNSCQNAGLPAALQRADIVHFGYEAAAGQEIYKIYFEYASDVRAAIAEADAGGTVSLLRQ